MGKSIRFFEVPFKALMAVAAAIAFLGLPPSSVVSRKQMIQ